MPYYEKMIYRLTNIKKHVKIEKVPKKLKDDLKGRGDNIGHHGFEKNSIQFLISLLCYNIYYYLD